MVLFRLVVMDADTSPRNPDNAVVAAEGIRSGGRDDGYDIGGGDAGRVLGELEPGAGLEHEGVEAVATVRSCGDPGPLAIGVGFFWFDLQTR